MVPDQDKKNFSKLGPTWTRTKKIYEIPVQIGSGPRKISKPKTGPDHEQEKLAVRGSLGAVLRGTPTNIILKTTKVNIFFGELNYQTISQIKAYDFASLLGDIGGQMGLFIGIVHSRINSRKDRAAKDRI